jgi:HD domain
MRRHVEDGAEIVAALGDAGLADIVRHHHEHFDGSGYPSGLEGDLIPLGSRIIAVPDTFDAITSARPYRPARPHQAALTVLRNESGNQLDPVVVRAFIAAYTDRRGAMLWAAVQQAVPVLRVGVVAVAAAMVSTVAFAVSKPSAVDRPRSQPTASQQSARTLTGSRRAAGRSVPRSRGVLNHTQRHRAVVTAHSQAHHLATSQPVQPTPLQVAALPPAPAQGATAHPVSTPVPMQSALVSLTPLAVKTYSEIARLLTDQRLASALANRQPPPTGGGSPKTPGPQNRPQPRRRRPPRQPRQNPQHRPRPHRPRPRILMSARTEAGRPSAFRTRDSASRQRRTARSAGLSYFRLDRLGEDSEPCGTTAPAPSGNRRRRSERFQSRPAIEVDQGVRPQTPCGLATKTSRATASRRSSRRQHRLPIEAPQRDSRSRRPRPSARRVHPARPHPVVTAGTAAPHDAVATTTKRNSQHTYVAEARGNLLPHREGRPRWP